MLEAHPLADMFPLIEGQAFDDLVASIRNHGLVHPIILLDGKILDGRNRYRACLACGREPHFVEYSEADPDRQRALVDAVNLQRRHLNESQRALLAIELNRSGMSRAEAAAMVNVSPRTLVKAAVVKGSGDAEIIDLVGRGKVSLHRAEQVLKKEIPRDALLTGRAERAPGRPQGNMHVHRLEKALEQIVQLKQVAPIIVKNWRGDPQVGAQLIVAIEFLRSIEEQTKEADHATAIA